MNKIEYKGIEYTEGDIIEVTKYGRKIVRGKLQYGTYDDHEGYAQYIHLGWHIRFIDEFHENWVFEMTLPDAISIFGGRKIEEKKCVEFTINKADVKMTVVDAEGNIINILDAFIDIGENHV